MKVFLSSGKSIAHIKEEPVTNQCGEQSRSLLTIWFEEVPSQGAGTQAGDVLRVLEVNVPGDWHLPKRERVRQVHCHTAQSELLNFPLTPALSRRERE